MTLTSETGLETRHELEPGLTGRIERTTYPDGTRQELTVDAGERSSFRLVDGSVYSVTWRPDPRFGTLSQFESVSETTLPSGLLSRIVTDKQALLQDPQDLFSLQSETTTVDYNGRVYTTVFDAQQRRSTTTTPEGRTLSTLVDPVGRMLSFQSIGMPPVELSYDSRGRVAGVSQTADGQTRQVAVRYGSDGLVDQITDPLGRPWSVQRDAAGRGTVKRLPDGREIGFQYDPNDNIVAVTPPGRPAHSFSYDRRNLKLLYSPPALASGATPTTYEYGADRGVTRIERPDGRSVVLNDDAFGRHSATLVERGTIEYDFDAFGNLQLIRTPEGQDLHLSWDGPLLTEERWAGPVSGTLTRTFDSDFRLSTQSVDGDSVAYTYDQDNLMLSAGDLTLTREAASGFLTGSQLGGVSDSWSYTGFGERLSYAAGFGALQLYAVDWQRDAIGRVTQRTEVVEGQSRTLSYEYDQAGRLVRVSEGGATLGAYVYDSNSNRVQITAPQGTQTAEYDDQDRLLRHGSTVFTYTASGELASRTDGTGVTSFEYDELGNLLRVQTPAQVIDYLADGRNRRIAKSVDGVRVQAFLYGDLLNPVAEMDGQGNLVARFVYGTRTNVPDYMVRGGQRYRILSDQRGSPRLVVNVDTGQVAQRLDYDPWGRVVLDTQPGFQPFGFAGGIWDRDTGLVRFGARDYDPEAGRWTARDPLLFDAGDSNLYAYAMSDPVNFTDPTGLCLTAAERQTLINNWSMLGAAVGSGTALVAALTFAPPLGVLGGSVVIGAGGSLGLLAGNTVGNLIADALDCDTVTRDQPRPVNRSSDDAEPSDANRCPPPDIPYPGDDASRPPGPEWEWRGEGEPGKGEGAWHRPGTKESLYPELNDTVHGPHWDYTKRPWGRRNGYRMYPDGRVEPKGR